MGVPIYQGSTRPDARVIREYHMALGPEANSDRNIPMVILTSDTSSAGMVN